MRSIIAFTAVCVFAALVPWLYGGSPRSSLGGSFPGWPSHFEGRSLTKVPLTELEKRFQSGFPGKIGKFSDGRRAIVMRWVVEETRKLHPASDCYKGTGHSVHPLPIRIDSQGNRWGAMQARRGKQVVRISERISDEAGHGWTDVSAWYWSAFMGRSKGPWWAVTVVERDITRGETATMRNMPSDKPAQR